jgi:DNA-binding transcriptional LysR family regulator
LVKQGIAIGIMPDYIGDSERKVKRVLPDMEPMTFNTWLVVHRELHTNNRVRTVYDFLANELPPIIT